METDRWRQIEDLYHAASEVSGDERSSFLAASCGQDEELRFEVESLLSYETHPADILESPHLLVAAEWLAERTRDPGEFGQQYPQSAWEGQTVSHYRVLEKLGSGGMGEVYKAEDTRLGRFVALKFLSSSALQTFPDETLSLDTSYSERVLKQFEREGRACSALDHPNICIVHEVGEHQGCPYIVMQYLPGQTLAQEINGCPMPIDRIIDFGIQISEGLSAAHSAGIIHRDVKSANILITRRGEAKILDFGLAKFPASGPPITLAEGVGSIGRTTEVCSYSLFLPGRPLGSISYMSPEQVLGKELDARSDLFSLGIVLYEMATGATPFSGQKAPDIVQSILHQDPVPVSRLNPGVPKDLKRIIEKATHKLPALRYQHAGELMDDLRRVQTKSREKKRALAPVTVLASALVIVAGSAAYFQSHELATRKPTRQSTVLLADFSNTTGETILDQSLRQALRAQLEQSPFLNVISDEKTKQALSYMQRPPDTTVAGDVAREACLRSHGDAVIEGSVSTVGNRYVVGLYAAGCQSGSALGDAHTEADDRKGVLRALGETAINLRKRLGETLATIEKYNTPVEQVTTGSLEALQAYSLAMHVNRGKGMRLLLLKRATELDPNFAMAYARLANECINFNQSREGSAALKRAYELRERVSERERFYIEAHYFRDVMGQPEKASQIYQLWQRDYPGDIIPYVNLMSFYIDVGQISQGISQGQEALRLDATEPVVYENLSIAHIILNQFDKATEVLRDAAAHHTEDPLLIFPRYRLAFAHDNWSEMKQQVTQAAGIPGMEDLLLSLQADTEAYHGRLERARAFTRRAIKSARHNGDEETEFGYAANGALREAEFGNQRRAMDIVTEWPRSERGEQALILGALAMARAGASRQALTLSRNLNQSFPDDTLLNEYWLPAIRAAVELNAKNPAQAVESLEAVRQYDWVSPRFTNFATLYPVYLRGMAYLALGSTEQARTEFQKILDHPGLTCNGLIGALAHLALARAYATEAGIPLVSGQTTKAERKREVKYRADALAKGLTAYQDFLAIWKDADHNIPLLIEAHKEFDRLRQVTSTNLRRD
jgi:serine/threonine protein kinase/tetratricopeptide (TPR) repeat protein